MFTSFLFTFYGGRDGRIGTYQGSNHFLKKFGSNPEPTQETQRLREKRKDELNRTASTQQAERDRILSALRGHPLWQALLIVFFAAALIDFFAAIGIVRAIGASGAQRFFGSVMLAMAVYGLTAITRSAFVRANNEPILTHLLAAVGVAGVYIGVLLAVAWIRYAELSGAGDPTVGASVTITLALTAGPGWVMDSSMKDLRKQLPTLREYWQTAAALAATLREESRVLRAALAAEAEVSAWIQNGVRAMSAYNIAYNHIAVLRKHPRVAPEDAGWPPEILRAAHLTPKTSG